MIIDCHIRVLLDFKTGATFNTLYNGTGTQHRQQRLTKKVSSGYLKGKSNNSLSAAVLHNIHIQGGQGKNNLI